MSEFWQTNVSVRSYAMTTLTNDLALPETLLAESSSSTGVTRYSVTLPNGVLPAVGASYTISGGYPVISDGAGGTKAYLKVFVETKKFQFSNSIEVEFPASGYAATDGKTVIFNPDYPKTREDIQNVGRPITLIFEVHQDPIRIGRDVVFPLIDGTTPGTSTTVTRTSAAGTDVTYTGLVGTGLARDLLRDVDGNLVFSDDGRPLYAAKNSSPGFYDAATGAVEPCTEVSAQTFSNWNEASQVEYLLAQTAGGRVTDLTTAPAGTNGDYPREVIIGGAAGGLAHVVLSANRDRVYTLESLTRQDFATIPAIDQKAIMASSAYQSIVVPKMGAVVSIDDADLLVQQVEADINAGVVVPDLTALGLTQAQADERFMTAANAQVFLDELTNLRTRLANTPIINSDDLKKKIAEIQARFDRAKAYGALPQQVSIPYQPNGGRLQIPQNVRSDDDDATIQRGFKAFMANERHVLELDNQRLALSETGRIGGRALDAPMLIYQFQLNYNLRDEAINNANVEEVNQTNALLRLYSKIQDKVNTVLQVFDAANDKDVRNFIPTGDNPGIVDPTTLDRETLALVQMFNNPPTGGAHAPATTATLHPVEVLKNVDRPIFMLYNMTIAGNAVTAPFSSPAFSRNAWSQYATRLSDAVTQLNQDNQLKMNDINSLDKQKNRHFDLATNALSKMSEIIQSIARSVG